MKEQRPAKPRPGSRDDLVSSLGDATPLAGGSGRRAPDKRRVSIRWLTGSVLTGLTSLLLMGGALYAALDGRQKLAQPPSVLPEGLSRDGATAAVKGDRPFAIVALEPTSERILQVPTVTRLGESNVIRKRPFAYASAPLAVVPRERLDYPRFDPLTVFRSSEADKLVAATDVIYGADVESEVLVQHTDFPLGMARYDKTTQISAFEAEEIVRSAMNTLDDGVIRVAALPYVDPGRFQFERENPLPPSALNFRIVAENVSSFPPEATNAGEGRDFSEEVLAVRPGETLDTALTSLNLEPSSTKELAAALTGELGRGTLQPGTRLRVAWEQEAPDAPKLARRISVYRGGSHLNSIALNDAGKVVWGTEPAPIPATAADGDPGDNDITTVARKNLPSLYDGLYRAALSQGLGVEDARRIIRTVAFDVDFRSRVSRGDALEVFHSLSQSQEETESGTEILFIGLTQSGKTRSYYRFASPDDGTVDYYDSEGRSAKKFLLRKPVPNGRFRSGFGPRRHPISRRFKMHNGVDFSAPRGTPIIAAGNGVVVEAGWGGGCGRKTVIRHANGYRTTYCHQHRIARGIRKGRRVAQGQIIGTVGSTGYSTGPHLHYEVAVNGRKVNPMKIRLPQGRILKGEALTAFQRERSRIDTLLAKARGDTSQFAALTDS